MSHEVVPELVGMPICLLGSVYLIEMAIDDDSRQALRHLDGLAAGSGVLAVDHDDDHEVTARESEQLAVDTPLDVLGGGRTLDCGPDTEPVIEEHAAKGGLRRRPRELDLAARPKPRLREAAPGSWPHRPVREPW
jgi:hypothetical protein